MKQSKIISYVFSGESSTEPVSLTDTKAHLYIDSGNTDFDAYLSTTQNLIKLCREYIERITGRSLIDRTVTLYVQYESEFGIPFGPTITLTSAAIWTSAGTYETKTVNSDYEFENGRFISYGGCQRWKLVYTIVAVVPHGLKMATLNEIAKRFEHRGDEVQVLDTNDLIIPYKDLEWLV